MFAPPIVVAARCPCPPSGSTGLLHVHWNLVVLQQPHASKERRRRPFDPEGMKGDPPLTPNLDPRLHGNLTFGGGSTAGGGTAAIGNDGKEANDRFTPPGLPVEVCQN